MAPRKATTSDKKPAKKAGAKKPMKEKRNNQVTGNVGMYYAAYRLSELGYNVIPTARNTKGIDLVVCTDDASRMVGVQVKCLSKRHYDVPLGKHEGLEHLDGTGAVWCIVVRSANDIELPIVYVLTVDEVKSIVSISRRDNSQWIPHKLYAQEQFKNAWHKISGILDVLTVE